MKYDQDKSLNTPPSPAIKAEAIEVIPGGAGGGGYCSPPTHSRFKPGQSGCPSGRPPGIKSLADIVRKILAQ